MDPASSRVIWEAVDTSFTGWAFGRSGFLVLVIQSFLGKGEME
jgi:hypothetical protein